MLGHQAWLDRSLFIAGLREEPKSHLRTAHGKNEGSATAAAAAELREEIFQQVVGWMAAGLLSASASERAEQMCRSGEI